MNLTGPGGVLVRAARSVRSFGVRGRMTMIEPHAALTGRETPVVVSGRHVVLDTPLHPPFPLGMQRAVFGLGCFWGAERLFWNLRGVFTTAVGYAGGYTPHPTYEEVCTSRTGHAEAVLVVFDPDVVDFGRLLAVFFEGHDPTQYMRQGNDYGTQYRSIVLATTEEQFAIAATMRSRYGEALEQAGYRQIVTEVAPAGEFFYAEEYHQQYLAKDPTGYCGLAGTGVRLDDP